MSRSPGVDIRKTRPVSSDNSPMSPDQAQIALVNIFDHLCRRVYVLLATD